MVGYILFLKPGSTAVWGDVPIGESQGGISIHFNFTSEGLFNQRLSIPVDWSIISFRMEVSASFIPFQPAMLEKFLFLAGVPTDWQKFPILTGSNNVWQKLELKGEVELPEKLLEIEIYKAVVSEVSEFTLGKEEAKITVRFQGLHSEEDNAVGRIRFV